MNPIRSCTVMAIAFALVHLCLPFSSPATHAAGIVASIEKAPVIADGNVRGMPTDYVINLEGSLDPADPGRTLAAGDVIKIIFPRAFDLGSINPAYPVLDPPTPLPPLPVLSDNDCVPAYLTCTTLVLLRGWPQDPFFPPALFHTLSVNARQNALIITALQDMGPSGDLPGIKQIHLILNGVTNPRPGMYQVKVEAQTGPGGSWETGSGIMRVMHSTRPSINVTSVFVKALTGQLGEPACGPGSNPPNPDNPIYQTARVNSAAPIPWTFLLWGRNNEALTDVRIQWINRSHALLRRAGRTIGHIFIDVPRGATGHRIHLNPLGCDTFMGGAPVIAATPGIGPQPVGRLDLQFQTGDKPGIYTTTLSLINGNTIEMVVTAE